MSDKKATARQQVFFTPYAYAIVDYFKKQCDTEFFGFGIARKSNPNLIVDIYIPKQEASMASVEIEEEDTLKMIEELMKPVDEGGPGLEPGEFMRYFIHTHPGSSPEPSGTDEKTFRDIFGKMDWSSMIIFAKTGGEYVRTQYTNGPGATVFGDVLISFTEPFQGVNAETIAAWKQIKDQRVLKRTYGGHTGYHGSGNYQSAYTGDYRGHAGTTVVTSHGGNGSTSTSSGKSGTKSHEGMSRGSKYMNGKMEDGFFFRGEFFPDYLREDFSDEDMDQIFMEWDKDDAVIPLKDTSTLDPFRFFSKAEKKAIKKLLKTLDDHKIDGYEPKLPGWNFYTKPLGTAGQYRKVSVHEDTAANQIAQAMRYVQGGYEKDVYKDFIKLLRLITTDRIKQITELKELMKDKDAELKKDKDADPTTIETGTITIPSGKDETVTVD